MALVGTWGPVAGAQSTLRIAKWTVSPEAVGYQGGPLTLSTTLTGTDASTNCHFFSSLPVPGLPLTVSCASGHASITVNVPGNTVSYGSIQYQFNLWVLEGSNKIATAPFRNMKVGAIPLPGATSLAVSPSVLPFTGGPAVITATVVNSLTCTLTASPQLPGLPITLPCASGSLSTNVTLPPNAGGVKPAVYSIYIEPRGVGPPIPRPPLIRAIVGLAPPGGYWLVAADGGVFTFGSATFWGSTGSMHLNDPIVGMASTPDGLGYWLVATDGGIFSFGDAHFYGSTGSLHLNEPIVAMAATPDGGGYFLVASDGGIFTFGDAQFAGSTGGQPLSEPIVGMAVDPVTGGYWLASADGGVFSFNAPFEGSMQNLSGVVDMKSTSDGNGYWLVTSAGGVYALGDAQSFGSYTGGQLNGLIVGIVPDALGLGYSLDAQDGGVFCYGNAYFLGSMGGLPLNAPMVGMTSPGVL